MKTKTRDFSTCLKRQLWIAGVCLATFSFFSASVAYAADDNLTVQQQKKGMTIKGKVLGTDGEAIIGASVVVKGSTTGVVTDLDGNYSLTNVPKGAILEFSFVGYVKLTKTVGSETTINAILYEDSQMLEGVEVVAFGTQKKESVIGAISTVKVAELKTPSCVSCCTLRPVIPSIRASSVVVTFLSASLSFVGIQKPPPFLVKLSGKFLEIRYTKRNEMADFSLTN